MPYPTVRTPAEPPRPPGEALRHLTQLDLARRWRISPRTLERWRSLRQGPAFLRLGAAIVYRLEDVETFETKQRHEAAGTNHSHARGGA
jgi:hypothetical protein